MTNNSKTPEQFELPHMPAKPDPRLGWTSASNARADSLCAGRHRAQAGLSDLPSEDGYAEHGQAIHEALAKRDPAGLSEAALQTYERCLEIEDKAVKQFFGDEAADLMTIAEERYWVVLDVSLDDPAKRKLSHSAQADRVYRSRTKALVVEYKTLPGDHPAASSNEQLRDQVCLVHGNLLVTTIGCVTVQPLVTMSPEICTYNAEQIKTATNLMFDRVRASNKAGALRAAGDIQCKYCRAKHQCAEYAVFVTAALPVMSSFVDSPLDTWTPEQCGVFLERYKTAEQWLEQAKLAIRRRIEAGELPGWQIGEGDRKFEVTDMSALAERCASLGIPNAELIGVCKPNKEGLTKLVRQVTSTKGKGLASQMDKLLDGVVGTERKQGSIERVKA